MIADGRANLPVGGAERRVLTILFCDLAGSTELAERTDPEALHELIREFLTACSVSVESLGGFVARFMGDGLLAYFGYPVAREDDAARAALAALKLRERTHSMVGPGGDRLQVRCGIATGPVIVGDLLGSGPAEERPVVGQTANLAARLQSLAPPNGVFICGDTADALGAGFDLRKTPELRLKGFSRPVQAWSVAGRSAGDADGAPVRRVRTSRFIGRRNELFVLQHTWDRAMQGRVVCVAIHGEPGIGKSRLTEEFRKAAVRTPALWLRGRAAQLYSQTPFHVVSEVILQQLAGHAQTDLRALLRGALANASIDPDEAYPLFAELLDLPTTIEDAPVGLAAEDQRRRLLAGLAQWFLNAAGAVPAVLLIEDLHWADPSTIAFLELLLAAQQQARLLVLITTREPHTLPSSLRKNEIALGRLDRGSIGELAQSISGLPLTPAQLEIVTRRADGVPLFAEELTRLIATADYTAGELPPTLAGLLAARLDQAGDAKRTAQLASILGVAFDAEVLTAMMGSPAEAVRRDLLDLTEAGAVIEQGGHFAFRHALIRDAAYQTLLKRQRRLLHERAAEVISEQFPDIASRNPEVLAQHWTEAGASAQAFAAWRKAAKIAVDRRAFDEAQLALGAALTCLETPYDIPEPSRQELELRSELAGLLQITRGYSAKETMEATAAARALAERNGDLDRQAANLANAWISASSAGRYEEAASLGGRLMPLARADGRADRLGIAAMMHMTSLYRTGEIAAAEEIFLGGRRWFASAAFKRRAGAIPQTLGNAAIIAWLLGKNAEARRRIGRAIALSERRDEPYERAFAAFMAATCALLARRPSEAESLAARARDMSDRHGFPQFSATTRIVLGAAAVQLDRGPEGEALIREGLREMAVTEARAGLTMYLTWFAEALRLGGNLEGAERELQHALTANPGERFYRPETLRSLAQLQHAAGDMSAARQTCRQALQEAKLLRARALHRRALQTLAEIDQGPSTYPKRSPSARPRRG